MAGIGYYNYQQYPLEQKHGWFQSGPGATAAVQVGDSLKRIAARLDVSDGTIGAGFIERRLGTSWEGGAAQAASGAFDRAAVVLTSLTTTSQAGGGTAQQFGTSFSATKNAIPVPPPPTGVNSDVGRDVDGFADAVHDKTGADLSVLGVQSDYRARLVANRNAELVADDALYRHENTTRDALAAYQSAVGSGRPAAPAGAGVQARSAGTGADGHGGAVGAGAAGGAAASTRGAGAAGGATGGGTAGGSAGAAGAGHPGVAGGGSGGAAGSGAGGGSGSAGGTASGATASAGSHGGTAGTESAGWTPLQPGQVPVPSGQAPGPSGLAPGPNGGYVPAGNTYGPAGTYAPTPLPPWQGSAGTGGYAGGYRGASPDQPLPPRTGGEPGPAMRGGAGAGATAGTGAARGPGQGGMAPMGMGGAGAGGRGRDHRNQFFIPEDEPFRVEYDFYVAPPVIGAGEPADHRDDR